MAEVTALTNYVPNIIRKMAVANRIKAWKNPVSNRWEFDEESVLAFAQYSNIKLANIKKTKANSNKYAIGTVLKDSSSGKYYQVTDFQVGMYDLKYRGKTTSKPDGPYLFIKQECVENKYSYKVSYNLQTIVDYD